MRHIRYIADNICFQMGNDLRILFWEDKHALEEIFGHLYAVSTNKERLISEHVEVILGFLLAIYPSGKPLFDNYMQLLGKCG